jgi:hypothetical protein
MPMNNIVYLLEAVYILQNSLEKTFHYEDKRIYDNTAIYRVRQGNQYSLHVREMSKWDTNIK